MNADRLLAHYELITDTPEAIPRLRRFILDLAVLGKLVDQHPEDESASNLLNRIAKKKARMVKAGTINLRKTTVREQEKPLDLSVPTGWELTELGVIAEKITDGAHKTPTYVEDGVPFVSVKDFSGGILDLSSTRFIPPHEHKVLYQRCDPRRGDILIARIGTLGKAVLVDTDIEFSLFVSVGLVRFDHHSVNPEFLRIVLNSPFVESEFDRIKIGGGTHTNKLNLGDLHTVALPLPPIAEQRRIVSKVDELMELCDQLQAARTKREATRNRLATASLARLNAPDPDRATFRNHATFVLDNLTPLTTRPDQIKALRQTILNLAIRGKLMTQDADDESASDLLKRIALEKARLVETREIKAEKKHQPIAEDYRTFQIPKSWTWCRLGSLSKMVTSGSRDWAKYYSNEGAIFVRMGNLSKDHYRLRLDNIQRVKAPSEGEGTRTRLEAGDLLISITGDVGMLGHIPENFGEAYINQHTAMVRPMDEVKGRYLPELFRSPFAQEQFNAPQRGIKNSFRLTDITQFLVPLPPLAEQHRIVAKVDELMALCDRLEENLAAGDYARRRLLETVLHDALEPDTDSKAAA